MVPNNMAGEVTVLEKTLNGKSNLSRTNNFSLSNSAYYIGLG